MTVKFNEGETKVVVISEPTVEITLTESEAKNLRAILGGTHLDTLEGYTHGTDLSDLGLYPLYSSLTKRYGYTYMTHLDDKEQS